jgi:hypothetical protein
MLGLTTYLYYQLVNKFGTLSPLAQSFQVKFNFL